MRIFVVKSGTDLATLRAKLIRADAGADAVMRAEGRLKEANPHVAFDRLKPGAVLIVPDAPEFAPESTENIIGLVLEEPVKRAAEGLAVLKRRLEAGTRGADVQRELLVKALKSRGVKAAADSDEQLRKDIDRLGEILSREAKESAERARLTEQTLAQAEADLKQLQQRFA